MYLLLPSPLAPTHTAVNGQPSSNLMLRIGETSDLYSEMSANVARWPEESRHKSSASNQDLSSFTSRNRDGAPGMATPMSGGVVVGAAVAGAVVVGVALV